MASIFDYQFNVGGNFTAAMDGMAESTGRFAAAVETSTQGLSKWEQKLAAFGLIGDYVDRACNAVNGIVEVGANAELQLMNLKTLFGGCLLSCKETNSKAIHNNLLALNWVYLLFILFNFYYCW